MTYIHFFFVHEYEYSFFLEIPALKTCFFHFWGILKLLDIQLNFHWSKKTLFKKLLNRKQISLDINFPLPLIYIFLFVKTQKIYFKTLIMSGFWETFFMRQENAMHFWRLFAQKRTRIYPDFLLNANINLKLQNSSKYV